MALNVKLLLKVKEHILAEPKRVDMNDWLSVNLTGRGAPPCGTVGCIAGWTVALGASRRKALEAAAGASILREAATLLRCTNYYWPFYSIDWPKDLRTELTLARQGTRKYARVVAKAIDRFIAEHAA